MRVLSQLLGTTVLVNCLGIFGSASADCTPNTTDGSLPPGTIISCTGVDADGFIASTQDDVTLNIDAGADVAVGIYLDNDATVVNNGDITSTSDRGIEVDLRGDVTNNGTITINDDAQDGINTDDDTVVLNTGILTTNGLDSDGIDVDDDSIVTIGAGGVVRTTGDSAGGILAGERSVVNVLAGGLVSSEGAVDGGVTDSHGVLFDEAGGTLNNSGQISSTFGYGVFVDDDNPGNVTDIINNAGGVISGGGGAILTAGILVGDATVENVQNAGDITGDILLGAGADSIQLLNGSTINGSVDLSLGDDTAEIVDLSAGMLSGTLDGGDGSDTLSLIYNSSGSTSGLFATTGFETQNIIANGGATTVTIAAGTPLSGAIVLSGDGIVINNDDINVANDEGIFANNNITLINNANIVTTGDFAEGIDSGDNVSITHTGSIITDGENAEGIETNIGSTISVASGATIETSGEGAEAVLTNDNSVVNHAGSITTTGDQGEGIQIVDMGIVNIAETGSISTAGEGAEGIYSVLQGEITLNGSIETTGVDADGIDGDNETFVSIGSTGSIMVSGDGAEGVVLGTGSQMQNDGSVVASGASGAIGVRFDEGVGTLTNNGLISAVNGEGINVIGGSVGEVVSVINNATGVIIGGASEYAINGSLGTEEITNAGSITGNSILESGEDIFRIVDAGTVDGWINLGSDNDLFVLSGAGADAVTGTINGDDDIDTFIIDNAVTSLSGSQITNFEILNQLSGSSNITDDISFDIATIGGGNLNIMSGAELDADVTVANGAVISGLGDIGGDLNLAGTFLVGDPSGQAGTVGIGGDLSVMPGSDITIYFSSGTSSLIDVAGQAVIDGGEITLSGNLASVGSEFTIISADGGITENSPLSISATNLLFAEIADVVSSGNDVVVQVNQLLDGSSIPLSMNASSAGAVLQNELGGEVDAQVLNELMTVSGGSNSATLDYALRGLSPEIYTNAPTMVLFEQFEAMTAAFDRRAFVKEDRDRSNHVWSTLSVGDAFYDLDGGTVAYDLSDESFAMGFDTQLRRRVALGAMLGFSSTDADGLSSEISGSTYSFGGYAVVDFGKIAVNSLLAYAKSNFDADRSVANGLSGAKALAEFDANSLVFHHRFSYDVFGKDSAFQLRPSVTFDYYAIRQDGFEEGGDTALGLAVDQKKQSISYAKLGTYVSNSWALPNGLNIRPEAEITWNARLSGAASDIRASFSNANAGGVMIARGANLPGTVISATAGLSIGSEWWNASVNYRYGDGNGYLRNGVTARIDVRF
ncbi:autotransporter domain-containing protein [Hyphococcus formosus]|uniref:autotransporter domain-containing protein n=1 Tax=Hyphococcus formosus TaxID=3143534 RepID=UPI00398AC780